MSWVARIWALLVILVGSYAILITAVAPLVGGLRGVFLALGLSLVLTWVLRPRLGKAGQPRKSSQAHGPALTADDKRFVWIMLGAGAAVTTTTVAFVMLHVGLVPLVPLEALGVTALILVLLHRAGDRARH